MKIAVSGSTTMPFSLIDDVINAKKAGFEALEVWRNKLTQAEKEGLESLISLSKQTSMVFCSVNALQNATSIEKLSDTVDECRYLCSIAQKLGAEVLTVCPHFLEAPASEKQLIEESAIALRKLAKEARQYGIKIALEFLYFERASVRTIGFAREVVEKTAVSNIGIVVDSCHLYLGGSTAEELRDTPKEMIHIVHIDDIPQLSTELKDTDRVIPGQGILPLSDFVKDLEHVGYDGYISLELFNEDFSQTSVDDFMNEVYQSVRKLLSEVK